MDDERRVHSRKRMQFPVGIETPSDHGARRRRVAVVRDASEGGLMLGAPRGFEIGERLTLAWRSSGKDGRRTRVRARVVRSAPRPRGHRTSFPYLLSVEFERPLHRLPFKPDRDEE